jgi:hypothetical protein
LKRALYAVLLHVSSALIRRSLEVLYELPTPAFERAMAQWMAAKNPLPGIKWLAGEIEALGDAELAFRLGALLLDRPEQSMSSGRGVITTTQAAIASSRGAPCTKQLSLLSLAKDVPLEFGIFGGLKPQRAQPWTSRLPHAAAIYPVFFRRFVP